jgi:transposase
MSRSPIRHAATFQARVALDAAKPTKTLAELAKTYQVHPVPISQWKPQPRDGVASLCRDGRRRARDDGPALQAELDEQLGRLNLEVEWWKQRVARGG